MSHLFQYDPYKVNGYFVPFTLWKRITLPASRLPRRLKTHKPLSIINGLHRLMQAGFAFLRSFSTGTSVPSACFSLLPVNHRDAKKLVFRGISAMIGNGFLTTPLSVLIQYSSPTFPCRVNSPCLFRSIHPFSARKNLPVLNPSFWLFYFSTRSKQHIPVHLRLLQLKTPWQTM